MRRFRVGALPTAGGHVSPEPEVAHHMLSVVRVARGERVELFDGTGRVAVAELVEVTGDTPVLRTVEDPRAARPDHPVHLLVGLPKGPAMDAAVRMATEAGATDVHPVLLSRSVATGDRADRWARIAASAAQQCGRGDVPAVHPVATLDEVFAALPPDIDGRIALPGAPSLPPASGPVAVLVGPEGGFAKGEIQLALAADFRPMSLGRWIWRTETAAAVALALATTG